MEIIYHLAIFVVALTAIIAGFRRGFTRQTAGVLGLAFGVVTAHVVSAWSAEMAQSVFPSLTEGLKGEFAAGIIGSSAVCLSVMLLFSLLNPLLAGSMSIFEVGMLDRIFGSVYKLLRNLVILSMAYNMVLCVHEDGVLLRAASATDGNSLQGVILLAPILLGCETADELAHRIQLREAKKISCNISGGQSVSYIEGTEMDTRLKMEKEC